MHPYATNSEERSKIPFFIAGLAIGIAWLISFFVSTTRLPFWLEVPGTASLYMLLFALFRSYVWSVQPLNIIGLVKVPNLEGEWRGHVTSTFDQLAEQHPITVHIRQNWTHMSIKLVAGHSESHSVVASIYVADDETVLSYQYENVPNAKAKNTMHAHTGTATLKLTEDRLNLSGDYYSGRDRGNQGELVLRKHERRRRE
jgi:hypothetical protein